MDESTFACVFILSLYLTLNFVISSPVLGTFNSACKNLLDTNHARKVKIHHVEANREIFYAYYGNTAVDFDSLPVSRARLTVVEPALFE